MNNANFRENNALNDIISFSVDEIILNILRDLDSYIAIPLEPGNKILIVLIMDWEYDHGYAAI